MSLNTSRFLNPIDNAPLIVFRIFFGLLIAAESFGAIMTGWVRRILVEPKFTFSHIGLEWLQPLPGNGMYFYFAAMGCLGLAIALGYKYRWAMIGFTVLWGGVYFMQKSAYNNHYYLLLLISFLMIFQPAEKYASLDAKYKPSIKTNWMPKWCSDIMIFQMFLVYTFATIAKFYPDWLDGRFTGNLFKYNQYADIFPFFKEHWFHLFLAYSGIVFDGLIIPALLWKRTRTIAFIAAAFFHLFNAVTLEIGIFPFFALSFIVFFYPPEAIGKVFFKNRVLDQSNKKPFTWNIYVKYLLIIYFIFQILLPLRHWLIKGDVLWTDEGHRLSWRMMLRQRSGDLQYKIIDKKTNTEIAYDYTQMISKKQYRFVTSHPDGIWQMAQYIKKDLAKRGKDVEIYARSYMTINHNMQMPFIDPKVNLAEAKWNYFWHNDWILLYDDQWNLIQQ